MEPPSRGGTVTSELETVLGRVEPYRAQVASKEAALVAFSRAWEAIEQEFGPTSTSEGMHNLRSAVEAPELPAAYVAVVPCVEALVATELDAITPGERGLGRIATTPPRLAGAFRKQLSRPETRAAFGPLIEATIRDAYAGTAAVQPHMDVFGHPRVRPAEQVFAEWVPRMYAGTQGMNLGIELIAACNSETEIRLFSEARQHGLISGLRSKQKEQVFIECAGFWIAAGAALYRIASDQPD